MPEGTRFGMGATVLRDVAIAARARMPVGWRERSVNALMSALAPLL